MRDVFVTLLLLSLLSCQQAEMKTLSEAEMANVLLDLTISDQVITLHQPHERDSIREALMNNLLKIHNLERNELDSNLVTYMSDFERYGHVNDIVKGKLDSLLKEEDK